ncbi:HigA family addiction module antitoxin [Spiribacter roseus]|uniref:HigA family addiction module antitoxin n=1 Tax=Spiribacter roseus TaxID=1855875 RepID=A0ABV3RUK5_9GAMM
MNPQDDWEAPMPPGDVLGHEFMIARGLKPATLARALRVPVNRITDILAGKRRITAPTALLLADYFETSPDFWLRLQMDYDLRLARRNRRQHSAFKAMMNSSRAP